MRKLSVALLLMMLASHQVIAATGWQFKSGDGASDANTSKTNTIDKQKQFHYRYPGAFKDDITLGQNINDITLTSEQKHQRQVWDLSEREEKRYAMLMKNKSGTYYKNKNLSPLEVLGINARDDAERLRFANQVATTEAIRVAKELAFSASYHKSYQDLIARLQLPVIHPFDTDKYSPLNYEPVNVQEHDRFNLYLSLNSPVRSIMHWAMQTVNSFSDVTLDIYFIGEDISHEQISTWAKVNSLPPSLVGNKIRLHSETVKALSSNKSPQLVRIRSGISTAIKLERI